VGALHSNHSHTDFVARDSPRYQATLMTDFFKNNFGGFIFALIVVLAAYSAIGIWEPKYAAAFAVVTLLGIGMFWLNKNG
jgi:hypothetical protein